MLWLDDLYLLREHLVSSNYHTSISRLLGFLTCDVIKYVLVKLTTCFNEVDPFHQ